MGLLSILRKIKQKEKEVRLLILGLDNAGKTTVTRKLCGDPIDEIEPTLGFNIQTIIHKAGYTLNLWDVGGQTSIRAYWRNYYEATDGLIWVVDSSDVLRLQNCRQELSKLLQEERLAGATLLVLANKQDASNALTAEEIQKVLELDKLPDNRHWSIQPCSAYTGQGLVEGLDWLVHDIADRIYMLN